MTRDNSRPDRGGTRLWVPEGNGIVIRPNATIAPIAGWLLAVSVLVLAPVTAVGLHLDLPALWCAGVLLGCLALISATVAWFVSLYRVTIAIDEGRVAFRKHELDRRDISAVSLGSMAKVVYDHDANPTVQKVWTVGFLSRRCDPQATQELEDFRKQLDTALADDGELDPESERHSRQVLDELRPRLGQVSTRIPADLDEVSAWQVSEALAKRLDVPVLDYSGEVPVERSPAELDLPLGVRLARRGTTIELPGDAPESLDVTECPDFLEIRWLVTRDSILVKLGVLSVVVAMIGLALLVVVADKSIGLWLIGLGVGLFAILVILSRVVSPGAAREPHELRVDSRCVGLSWKDGARRYEMPLADLEAIRGDSILGSTLNLVSDDLVIRCPMDAQQIAWVRPRLERFLMGRQRA